MYKFEQSFLAVSYKQFLLTTILCNLLSLWWNPPLQKIVITQGNPGLPWVFFHVETTTIDYFVSFLLLLVLSKGSKPRVYPGLSKPRVYPGLLKPRVYPGLPWVIICDNFNSGFHHWCPSQLMQFLVFWVRSLVMKNPICGVFLIFLLFF